MARSRTADPGGEMTADEEAQLTAMQEADNELAASEAPAPRERAAPQPEPATDEGGQDADTAPPPAKTVPLAALLEERNARKEMERQLRLLEDRTNLLFQQRQQAAPEVPKPQEPAIPELDKDPVGHIVGMQQAQQQRLEAFANETRQRETLVAQANQIAALQSRATALEADFQSQQPDYPEAVKHLQAARHEELKEIGYTDAAQRHQIIIQEGLGLAARALQDGRNPAEIIYSLSKRRGYTPADAVATADADVQTPTQRLQQVAAGRQQARSLGNARGTGPAPLTANRLIEMSESEFAKMMDTAEGKALLGA